VTSAYSKGIADVLNRSGVNVPIRGREVGRKMDILISELEDSRFVYVTDTSTDVYRCKDLGVPVIAVTWGYDDLSAIEAAIPDHICNSKTELVNAIHILTNGGINS